MGVSGSGKSTIAKHFAQKLNVPFLDADDYHSEMAKQMMQNGEPLSEIIRSAWVDRLLEAVSSKAISDKACCLAYSGLKAEHRQRFLTLPINVFFFKLHLSIEEAANRINNRKGHFFPAHLIQSQFDAMEPVQADEKIHIINAQETVDEILRRIFSLLP